MGYTDFREYLNALEKNGLLHRITRPVNKDHELMPLVRWQFRGLPAEQRKAFLFENVFDARGRKFTSPVAVAVIGASRAIYAMAMGCKPEEIAEKWDYALRNPITPRLVKTGPAKEIILRGKQLAASEGVDAFPVPISTPGFDPAPYLTSPFVVTRDPDNGAINVGTYRAQIKGKFRTGIMTHQAQHIGIHLSKARKLRKPLPAAIAMGCVPAVALVSVTKVPYGVDEYTVASAIQGQPLELVPCETVDLLVPASSEIVLEGEISTEILEPEAPFGEYTGYMGPRADNHVFEIKCITHRKNPYYQAFISQCPPSESSLIRKIGWDATLLKFLKYDCNIPAVEKVAFHESSGSWGYLVIQLKKSHPAQAWQALNAAVAYEASMGKVIIAVDEDIDPEDPDSVNWALSFRMQPHLDARTTTGKCSMLDPSSAPPGTPTLEQRFPKPVGTSALLIDATRKWGFPAVSLPAREYMEKARAIWEEEGLPPLSPREPWHGYALGYWPEEWAEDAKQALAGRYLDTGENLAKAAVPIVGDDPFRQGGEK